ncbi:MAG: hypothetical protein LC803_21930 [Acidobacteria bacterium]|nr:hypothetical protein [Acidobacteriota bacterium]
MKMPLNRLTVLFARACAVWCLLSMCAAVTGAQEKSPQRGFNAGGSYAISDIETISATGGNLSLRVPVASLPAGRGGLKMSVNLVYNSKLYDGNPDIQWVGVNRYEVTRLSGNVSGAGWDYSYKYKFEHTIRSAGLDTQGMELAPCSASPYTVKATLTTPDGSKHPLVLDGYTDGDGYQNVYPDGRPACTGGPSLNTTLSYYTTDGTFLRVEVAHDDDQNTLNNPWTIHQPDGGRISGGDINTPQRIYDRNNNYIEIVNGSYNGHPATYLNDQVGRSVIIELNSAANQDSVHVRVSSNELLTTVVRWTNVQVRKSYDGGSSADLDLVHNHRSVQGIDLPWQAGALSYAFTYNANGSSPTFGWGELSSVTLPSGAKATYQYLYDGQNNLSADQVLRNRPTQKQLVYRPEYDLTGAVSNAPCTQGCTTETWAYVMTYASGGEIPIKSTITGPDGGVTTEYFNMNESGVAAQNGLVYKSVRADNTVVERYWQMNRPHSTSPSGLAMPNYYAKFEFTSVKDANGNQAKTAVKEFSQDKNGNTTVVKEYDWLNPTNVLRDAQGRPYGVASGVGIQPKRVTTSSYYAATPDAANTTFDADTYNQPDAPQFRSAVAASEVASATQTLTRTEYVYDNPTTTANMTGQKSWDSQKGAYSNPLTVANSMSVSTQYNSYGSPTLSIDARKTKTLYTYGAVGGYADLYPTIIKTAFGTTLEQVSTREYNYYTGAVTRTTDPNGAATATTYDAFGRPTLVKAAEGIAAKESHTTTVYSDAQRRVIVRSDLTNAGDGKLVSIQHYDQLGRVRLSRQLEDSATQSETDETAGVKVQMRYLYSGSNSYQLISNPYRAAYAHEAGGEYSMGWTRSKADNGGRPVETQTFNGATLPAPWGANASGSGTVTTSYNAEFTTVTDQATRARRSAVNGLGQLARVDEPDKDTGNLDFSGTPVQPTSYSYDALGNLTHVAQGAQARTFNYSSLSRIISATNPESGTVSYTYDAGGNLLTKTDARAVTITYGYDALSRNKTVDYSNTTINPDIERYYDNPAVNAYGRGRFWKDYKGGNDINGSEVEHRAVDAYDALGRPLAQWQKFKTGGVWSGNYTTGRTYTRSGLVETQTLPSGHTINHTYDVAGRLQTFTGNLGDGSPRTYSTGVNYDAAGRMTREQFGTQTPLHHKRHYNTRGQLHDVRLGSATDEWSWNRGAIVAYYDGAYSWTNNGNGPTGADNNGNVKRSQVWVPGNDEVTSYALSDEYFDYDMLNRLKSVNEYREGTSIARAQAFVQTYHYDRWGNRTIDQGNTTQTLAPEMRKAFKVDEETNRLGVPSDQTGSMSYDLAGNLSHDSYTGQGDRVYDAENRMTSAVIGINSSSSYTYDANGKRVRRSTPRGTVWQIYGLDGELLAEYAAKAPASSPQKEYGYRNGELLVTAEGFGTSAAFVKIDKTTGGNWKGNYGAEGYNLVADGASHPAYVQLSATGFSSATWAASTTDVRALQKAAQGSTDRIASTFYSPTEYTVNINLTDGRMHRVALYCLDWDGNNIRAQRLEVRDAVTDAVLDSREVSAFSGGQYVVWNLRGNVKIKVIHTGPAGWNAVASGLFFDASPDVVQWLVTDHLGTPRITADLSGSLDGIKRHDYLPFGEEIGAGVGGRTTNQGYSQVDNVRQKFTGYERDTETGFDYALNRYYLSTAGRFTTVDPFNIVLETQNAEDKNEARLQFDTYLNDPQRWNRYAYVLNNPLKYVDPDGLDALVVAFTDYKISAFGLKWEDLGHAGIVTIDDQGRTRYFEYGRYDDAQRGVTHERDVPDLVIGADGNATPESFNNLMQFLSEKYGQGGSVVGAYYDTDEQATNAMNCYAEGRIAENTDGNRQAYAITSHNCATFTRDVLNAGNIGLATNGWRAKPNTDIEVLKAGTYRLNGRSVKPGNPSYTPSGKRPTQTPNGKRIGS